MVMRCRRRFFRDLLRICAMVPVALSLGTCGLESIVFLEGPRNDTLLPTSADPAISFRISFLHNSSANNIPEFLGYELWYKFYDDLSGSGAGAGAPFDLDRAAITASPVVLGPSRLESRGFRRMLGPVAGERPIIRLTDPEKADPSLRIYISFSPNIGIEPSDQAVATWPTDQAGATVRVLRRSVGGSSISERFLPVDEEWYTPAGDFADIPALFAAPPGQTARTIENIISTTDLAIGIFVIAYGQNLQTFQPIYSEPVSLSYAKVQ